MTGQSVQAKFLCNHSEPDSSGNHTQIRMSPVTDGSEENRKFFGATPRGTFEMTIVNQEAANLFEQGREYYLTIQAA